jgi:hypothetical protein
MRVWRSGLQSLELGGKMLALELNTGEIRIKVRRLVTDYLNKRDIADDPERVLKKIEWSVAVKLGH